MTPVEAMVSVAMTTVYCFDYPAYRNLKPGQSYLRLPESTRDALKGLKSDHSGLIRQEDVVLAVQVADGERCRRERVFSKQDIKDILNKADREMGFDERRGY